MDIETRREQLGQLGKLGGIDRNRDREESEAATNASVACRRTCSDAETKVHHM